MEEQRSDGWDEDGGGGGWMGSDRRMLDGWDVDHPPSTALTHSWLTEQSMPPAHPIQFIPSVHVMGRNGWIGAQNKQKSHPKIGEGEAKQPMGMGWAESESATEGVDGWCVGWLFANLGFCCTHSLHNTHISSAAMRCWVGRFIPEKPQNMANIEQEEVVEPNNPLTDSQIAGNGRQTQLGKVRDFRI